MKKLLIVLVLWFIASCKTLTQTSISPESDIPSEQTTEELPVEEQQAPMIDHRTYSLYEVGSLDTVASVARKYNISSAQLIQLNNLSPPYTLRAGSVIKVPASPPGYGATPDDEGMRTVHIKPKSKLN
jgi:LysM repeat protein